MHQQNLFAAFDVWVSNSDLTVKTTRTQQRRVQHILTVRRRDDDHTLIGFKTIHLNQQLVQCLLALVIATAHTNTTGTAHGVNLIDKHDARRVLFGLLEHVTDTGRTHTNEHLNKIRTGNRKERHTRLACNRARQQRLTCPRRALKQRALRDLTTKAAKFLRVAQEFNDFFQLFFGFINACDIIKRHTSMFLGQQFRLGFTKAHRTTFTATLHPVHEIDPNTNQ